MSVRDVDEHRPVLLGPYVLGKLSDDLRADVEEHLSWCAGCRVECQELREVLVALALLSEAHLREALQPDQVAPAAMAEQPQPVGLDHAQPLRGRRPRSRPPGAPVTAVPVTRPQSGIGRSRSGSGDFSPATGVRPRWPRHSRL